MFTIKEKYLTFEGILEDCVNLRSGANNTVVANLVTGEEVVFGKNDIKIRDHKNWLPRNGFYIALKLSGANDLARGRVVESYPSEDESLELLEKADKFHEQPDWEITSKKDSFRTLPGAVITRNGVKLPHGQHRSTKATRAIADKCFKVPTIEQKMEALEAWQKLKEQEPRTNGKIPNGQEFSSYYDSEISDAMFLLYPETNRVQVFIPKTHHFYL